MHFVLTGFSDWTEHISFILGVSQGVLAFRPIHFGNIWWSQKGPSFVFVGDSFHSLEVDGWGVACSSGEAAQDPVGVLPSASSFFSAFSILLRYMSSLLMAAPRLRSISLEVEMSNFAATSQMVLGLYFSPRHFLLVLFKTLPVHVPNSQDSFKQLLTPQFL